MTLRPVETSATYRYPDSGELNTRVTLRRRVDIPMDATGVQATHPDRFSVWATVRQVSATACQASAQTETTVTHRVTLRYRPALTTDYEVVARHQVFRVRRIRDLNSARRFLLLECEELGSDPSREGFFG
ncbi:MAG: phage head closure protein [Candidatus Hamiltonella defensa (Ceratovacuna japonica)]